MRNIQTINTPSPLVSGIYESGSTDIVFNEDVQIDETTKFTVAALTFRIRTNEADIRRAASQICLDVYRIKQHLGSNTARFLGDNLGVSDRAVQRYIEIGQLIDEYVSAGLAGEETMVKLSQRALRELKDISKADPELAAGVVEAIENSTQTEGVTPSIGDVRALVSAKAEQIAAERIEAATLKVEALSKELDEKREALDRACEQIAESESEIERLRSDRGSPVEIVTPPTAIKEQEAKIEALNRQKQSLSASIEEMTAKRKEIEAQVDGLESRLAAKSQDASQLDDAQKNVDKVISELGKLTSLYPQVMFGRILEADPTLKPKLRSIAQQLISFAGAIESAVGEH